MSNLAKYYDSIGDVATALSLSKECLDKRTRVLGEDHPHTLNSFNNLACYYNSKGDVDKALSLYKECLKKRKQVQGEFILIL